MAQTQLKEDSSSAIASELYQKIKLNQLEVPLLPDVANRVVQLTQDDESTAQSLATLIQSDQTLAAHIIRVANTAAYSPNATIVSLQQAIARLGMNTIAEIALSTSINASLFCAPGFEEEIQSSLTNSLSAGLWSKEVARANRKNVEAAFLSGLLCDIGRPMVLHTAYEISQEQKLPLDKIIMDKLLKKFSRAMSSRVVKQWDMPSSVQQVIIHFDDYKKEHPNQGQTHIAVAGMAITQFFTLENQDHDEIKQHPVFADLNLYEDEIEAILEKHDAINSAIEAMRS